jgi:repressor LexA
MKQISEKRQQIYDFILHYNEEYGYAPSVREIAAASHLKSTSTVHFHLKALEEAGYVSHSVGKTRSLIICRPELPEEEAPRPDQVPVLGNVAAGAPILAEQCIEDYLTFDTEGLSGEHFALRIRGESMIEAGIMPGDYVVVHRQQVARNGEYVIALIEDEATCKRFERRNGHIWLMPENREYQPIDGTNAQILGKVIAVVRKYG